MEQKDKKSTCEASSRSILKSYQKMIVYLTDSFFYSTLGVNTPLWEKFQIFENSIMDSSNDEVLQKIIQKLLIDLSVYDHLVANTHFFLSTA